MAWYIYVIAAALLAGTSWAAVGAVRIALLRHNVLDRPNARSSHTTATPRGGGIGVLIVALPAWTAIGLTVPASLSGPTMTAWAVPAGALTLALVSWIDDLRCLGPFIRLAGHVLTTAVLVLFLPGLVFQGLLPPLVDAAAAVLLWVWFINLFNFMDGIDGLAGTETVAIGTGLALAGLTTVPLVADHLQAGALAATALGFLVWNRPSAKIFLGDVGSVPLGYLLGWLLLGLAATGQWQAALILPLYYLADATSTLAWRLLRGEKIWQAHREHWYQKAVRGGRSHAAVTGAVGLVNTALVALAVIAARYDALALTGWLCVAVAALLVVVLLRWMATPVRT